MDIDETTTATIEAADIPVMWSIDATINGAGLDLRGTWEQVRADLLAALAAHVKPNEVHTWRMLTENEPDLGWSFITSARDSAHLLRDGAAFGVVADIHAA